jgi:hypothetical protein
MEDTVTIKNILLYLDSEEMNAGGNPFSVSLAKIFAADITANAIIIDATHEMAGYGLYPNMDVINTQFALDILEENRQNIKNLYFKFKQIVPPNIKTELSVIDSFYSHALKQFSCVARYYDITVVSQNKGQDSISNEIIISSLFGSGRPTFVIPQDYTKPFKFDKAIICWDGGIQATRTLADALPILAYTKNIDVLCIGFLEEDIEYLKSYNVIKYLLKHGIKANLHNLPSVENKAALIKSYAQENSADYIIMGGYGHWRLREMVFGGTTESMLKISDLPLFISH